MGYEEEMTNLLVAEITLNAEPVLNRLGDIVKVASASAREQSLAGHPPARILEGNPGCVDGCRSHSNSKRSAAEGM